MIGAIIGDVVGSRFEFNNIKTKEYAYKQTAQETINAKRGIRVRKRSKEIVLRANIEDCAKSNPNGLCAWCMYIVENSYRPSRKARF